MDSKQLCVCFETATLLKEKGFPQNDSYFVWAISGDKSEYALKARIYVPDYCIAAPTTDELLVELPGLLEIHKTSRGTIEIISVSGVIDWEKQPLPEALALLWLKINEV